jgi:hypothetical protein
MDCDHSGTHSGATRFSRHASELRLVLVCDQCGAEQTVLGRLDYCPNPEIAQRLSSSSTGEARTAVIADGGAAA